MPHHHTRFIISLLLAVATLVVNSPAVAADSCSMERDLQSAKADYLALREEYHANAASVSLSAYRAAAGRYIELAQSCYDEQYGVSPIGTLPVDDGGLWYGQPPGAENFVTFGTKWGAGTSFPAGQDVPGPGLPGGEVTYSYMPDGVDMSGEGASDNVAITSMPTYQACFTSEIEIAFDAWSAVADITFREVADDGLPFNTGSAGQIRIGSHVFDGPGSTLAHGYYPPPNGTTAAGDIHFDQEESWACSDTGSSFDFGNVALHEIGHAIGLKHQTPPPTAVMNPFYNAVLTDLQPDDIIAAVSIYGPAPVAAPACTMQSAQNSYSGSELVSISAFGISGAAAASAAVEWKVWIRIPGVTDPYSWINLGADGTLVLPPAYAVDFAPIQLFQADQAPGGTYELGCRLLDPVTGALINEDVNSFDVINP